MYLRVIPKWIQRIFSGFVWKSNCDKILLTFDDGPHPSSTEQILSTLKDTGHKAIFFCLGEQISRYPTLVKKIIDHGQSIGIHGYSHAHLLTIPFDVFVADFSRMEALLKSHNISVQYYRPPYGRITPRQYRFVRSRGYEIMLWDIMPGDFESSVSKEDCIRTIKKYSSKDSIIVMHDKPSCVDKVTFAIKNIPQ